MGVACVLTGRSVGLKRGLRCEERDEALKGAAATFTSPFLMLQNRAQRKLVGGFLQPLVPRPDRHARL